MASAINDNYPVQGNPTTASVRDNFTIAKNEITNLQSQVASLLAGGVSPGGPAGGVLAGQYPDPGFAAPLVLPAAPVGDMDAATKAYVDALEATVAALEARVVALETVRSRTPIEP